MALPVMRLKHLLTSHGLTLAVAESLTAGRLAAQLASVSGSSAYFRGGVLAYDIKAKVEILGVDGTHASHVNCVSEQVALQMARGVRRLFGTHVSMSTTGYAEPYRGYREDGSELVVLRPMAWYAVVIGDLEFTGQSFATEDERREAMQHRVVSEALRCLLDQLEELSPVQSRAISSRGPA